MIWFTWEMFSFWKLSLSDLHKTEPSTYIHTGYTLRGTPIRTHLPTSTTNDIPPPPSFGSIQNIYGLRRLHFRTRATNIPFPIGFMYVWYIYLHEWRIFYGINEGKYTVRPMDPLWVRQENHLSGFFKLKFECRKFTSPTFVWQPPRGFGWHNLTIPHCVLSHPLFLLNEDSKMIFFWNKSFGWKM